MFITARSPWVRSVSPRLRVHMTSQPVSSRALLTRDPMISHQLSATIKHHSTPVPFHSSTHHSTVCTVCTCCTALFIKLWRSSDTLDTDTNVDTRREVSTKSTGKQGSSPWSTTKWQRDDCPSLSTINNQSPQNRRQTTMRRWRIQEYGYVSMSIAKHLNENPKGNLTTGSWMSTSGYQFLVSYG